MNYEGEELSDLISAEPADIDFIDVIGYAIRQTKRYINRSYSTPLVLDLQEFILNLVTQRLKTFHKVGDYYITTNERNPETVFGGSWVKVEGKTLIGAGEGRALWSSPTDSSDLSPRFIDHDEFKYYWLRADIAIRADSDNAWRWVPDMAKYTPLFSFSLGSEGGSNSFVFDANSWYRHTHFTFGDANLYPDPTALPALSNSSVQVAAWAGVTLENPTFGYQFVNTGSEFPTSHDELFPSYKQEPTLGRCAIAGGSQQIITMQKSYGVNIWRKISDE